MEIDKIIFSRNINTSPYIKEQKIISSISPTDKLTNLLKIFVEYNEYFNNLFNNIDQYRKISDNQLLFLLYVQVQSSHLMSLLLDSHFSYIKK